MTLGSTLFDSIKALNQSMVEAGLCDPGAKSPTTRYGRLPFASNGMADPAQCVFEQLAQDPDRETLGRLLHAWKREFGNSPTMIREAVDKANSGFGIEELREALREVADERGEINRRRLGKWIARHQGRIVDGLRFERASGTTSAERWQVKAVVVAATASASTATSHSSVALVSCGEDATSVSEICEVEL